METQNKIQELQEKIRFLEEHLEQSQRLTALGELTSTTTHEFNNILTTILNYAKMGLRHKDDETRTRAFGKILSASERAAKIVSTVLAVAKNRKKNVEPTNLVSLTSDALLLLEREMTKYRVTVETKFAEYVPNVMADGNQIQQILLNLLINARQAMPNGGRLVVSIQYDAENEMVNLIVRDYGCGIPKDKLPHIFDRFWTTKNGPDESGKGGSGLGLSSCKAIIEQHKGVIRVESTEGKGTAFIVKLPTLIRTKILEEKKDANKDVKKNSGETSLVQHHPRRFADNHYVYPVISRRSGGLSIGVNLSPTALCNFACVYCQILGDPKRENNDSAAVNIHQLSAELRNVIRDAKSGALYDGTYLSLTPLDKQVLKDIAFSGDGEPTLCEQFGKIVEEVVAVRRELCPEEMKIVLITNGTTLHLEKTQNAIRQLLQNNGEVWTKLDAGTAKFYKMVARSEVPFDKILNHLTAAAKQFPLVIQTCFFVQHYEMPSDSEIAAYAHCLKDIVQQGGQIQRVQLYTVARNTAEKWVAPLSNKQLDGIADTVHQITGLPTETYYSS